MNHGRRPALPQPPKSSSWEEYYAFPNKFVLRHELRQIVLRYEEAIFRDIDRRIEEAVTRAVLRERRAARSWWQRLTSWSRPSA